MSKLTFILVLLPFGLFSQQSIRFSVEGQTVIPIFQDYTNATLSEYILSFQGTDATIAATNGFDVDFKKRTSYLVGINAEYTFTEHLFIRTGVSFYQLKFDEIFTIRPDAEVDTYVVNYWTASNDPNLLYVGPLFQPNAREIELNYYKFPVLIGYQLDKWSLNAGMCLHKLKAFERETMFVDYNVNNVYPTRITQRGNSSDFLNEQVVTVSFGLEYELVKNLHFISSLEMYLSPIYENSSEIKFLQNDYMDKSIINTLNVGMRYYFKQFDLD